MPIIPSVSWNDALPIYYETPLTAVQLNATSNVPGTFSYTPNFGTILNIGLNTLSVIFTPTDNVTYSSVTTTCRVLVLASLLNVVITPVIGYLELGSSQTFISTGFYSDGTSIDVTSITMWSCSTGGFVDNVYTPNVLSTDTIVATVNGFRSTLQIDIVPTGYLKEDKQHISHKTQTMLNYFDVNDRRVRKNTVSIDAQLLNIPAQLLEDLELRIDREQARSLRQVPTNIDNKGVYYSAPIPNEIELDVNDPYLSSVTGTINGQQVTLTPFDDRVPIPSFVTMDSSRTAFSITEPLLLTFVGPYDLVSFNSIVMPAPNAISLWVTGGEKGITSIDVSITGYVYPQSPWINRRVPTTETLTITGTGMFTSLKRWSTITNITFRNISANITIQAYAFPLGIAIAPDTQRPYSHWNSRDELYDRYWTIQPKHLMESYASDFGGGLESIQSYETTYTLTDVAVEPYTYGLLALSGTNLLYIDRRESLPSSLSVSALTVEPAYGIEVYYDFTISSNVRFVVLEPIPMSDASNVTQYRYTITKPSGAIYCLDSVGNLVPYNNLSGWILGLPVNITIPILDVGTYIFTLECIDSSVTVSSDSKPWNAQRLQALASLSLSNITPTPMGICYDSWGDLWCWDGVQAIPIQLDCASYILDAPNMKIYFTQPITNVNLL